MYESLAGVLCEGNGLPRGEDLGANKSRADYYYPPVQHRAAGAQPRLQTYCCYMPLQRPVGSSCLPDPSVPGCAPGRFGFSCLGPDHPEDSYPPMVCAEPGFSGQSAEGYDATLYCCDANEK